MLNKKEIHIQATPHYTAPINKVEKILIKEIIRNSFSIPAIFTPGEYESINVSGPFKQVRCLNDTYEIIVCTADSRPFIIQYEIITDKHQKCYEADTVVYMNHLSRINVIQTLVSILENK